MRMKVLTAVGGAALVAALLIPGLVLASGSTNALKANMTGAQVVPSGSGAPHGKGNARITLKPSKRQVCYRLTWTRVGSKMATGAGIFAGKPGSNGDRAAVLFSSKTASPASGCVTISAANSKDIRNHPGRFNVIVTTSKYPHHGAIRGQLKPRG
jgi:CHRD domain